ncbi:MAG TPA: DUF4253 domain-containing protein [Verrucomicrobiae bacterium]|jgi:Domain of unknown function (DUF4253)
MKNHLFCIGLVCVLTLAGCSKHDESSAGAGSPDMDAQAMSDVKTANESVAKPDFTAAARDLKYQQAVKEAAALLGAEPQPLEGADGPIVGGFSFDVPQPKIEAILFKAHTNFLAKGFYLFRYDQMFGIHGQPDKVGLLPTANKYDVMAALEVNGAKYSLHTAGIIEWMKKLEQEQPYVLTGIGTDYMEGYFTTPVEDPRGLARRMYKFCPDIVDQGGGTVDKLVNELLKGKLYFWWD